MASKMTPKSASKFDRFLGGSVTVYMAKSWAPGVPQGYHFMVSQNRRFFESAILKNRRLEGTENRGTVDSESLTPWAGGQANLSCVFVF